LDAAGTACGGTRTLLHRSSLLHRRGTIRALSISWALARPRSGRMGNTCRHGPSRDRRSGWKPRQQSGKDGHDARGHDRDPPPIRTRMTRPLTADRLGHVRMSLQLRGHGATHCRSQETCGFQSANVPLGLLRHAHTWSS
jgi:hypothetical protein